jgi:hypothetical protein
MLSLFIRLWVILVQAGLIVKMDCVLQEGSWAHMIAVVGIRGDIEKV